MNTKEIIEYNKKQINDNRELILNLYINEKKNIPDIAKLISVGQAVVWRFLKKENVNIRKVQWNQYDIDENYFENIDCDEKAYFLGWLFSDGFMIERLNRIGLRIHPRDREILEKYRKCLKTELPIAEYVSERKPNIEKGFSGGTYKICQFTFANEKICQDLKKYGMKDKKSLTLDWPKIDEKFIYPFMRGFIEGDGCLYIERKNNKVKRFGLIFLAPKDFVIGALSFFKKDGIEFSVNKSSRCDSIFNVANFNKTEVINLLDKIYFNHNGFYLSRKYNIYIEMKEYLEKNPVNQAKITNRHHCVNF